MKIRKYFNEIIFFVKIMYKVYRTIKRMQNVRQKPSTAEFNDTEN